MNRAINSIQANTYSSQANYINTKWKGGAESKEGNKKNIFFCNNAIHHHVQTAIWQYEGEFNNNNLNWNLTNAPWYVELVPVCTVGHSWRTVLIHWINFIRISQSVVCMCGFLSSVSIFKFAKPPPLKLVMPSNIPHQDPGQTLLNLASTQNSNNF